MSDSGFIENSSMIYTTTPERDLSRCCNLSSLASMDSGLEGSPRDGKYKVSPFSSPAQKGRITSISGSPHHKSPLGQPSITSTPNRVLSVYSDGGLESKTNLIVNYLPQNYTQDHLRELFRSVGEIETCKLCRNKDTKMSLGYGFVNYRHSEDARKAVESLNGLQIQNKMIKVSFARPSSQIIKNTNLYVAGLPKNVTLNEVKGLFGHIGKIISARILHDKETGLSKGVAFVRFDTRGEAEMAVKRLHQTTFHGETMTVKFACPLEKAEKSQVEEGRRQFEGKQDTERLTKAFQNMLLSYHLCPPRDFSHRNVHKEIPMVDHGALQQFSRPSMVPVFISVANLPVDVTEQKLWELFGPYGAVTSVKLQRTSHPDKPMDTSATVTMPVYQDALCAICALHNVEMGNQKLRVEFQLPALI